MACKEFECGIMEILYDEIEPSSRERLEAHLDTCSDCRTELAELTAGRNALAASTPDIPDAPSVIILNTTPELSHNRSFLGRYGMFAAGFAAAALMMAVGLATGYYLAPESSLALGENAGLNAQIDLVDQDQFQAELDSRDARLADLINRTSSQTQADLTRFSSALDSRRKQDLRFVLSEIMATEAWAGQAIGENRQSLRHLSLANEPGVTQW
jgi:hypothetical protein